MKFAFTATGCPAWELETIVAKAKEFGYDGVELRAGLPTLAEPRKVRALFQNAGLQIPCLATDLSFAASKHHDGQLAIDVKQMIDLAEQLDCPLVRLRDVQVRGGQNPAQVGAALADWLIPLGDYAAQHGRAIVVENALSFRKARELWMVLEQINSPTIAVAWNLCSATLAGETPAISVPTLSSRIQYALVKDARLNTKPPCLSKLGEGDVPIRPFLTRLRGIGYSGWIAFDISTEGKDAAIDPAELLVDAIGKLKLWTTPPVIETKKPEAKKVEARKPPVNLPVGIKQLAEHAAPAGDK